MTNSPAPWPAFAEDERDAVNRVLTSGQVNYWTGEEGRSFEAEFAEALGVEHAVFVANGTLALELALRSLNLPAGSEVITTPFTFIATSSAIVAAGLRPVFADVDADSGNIHPESIESAVTGQTSAVLVVHLGGWPADMAGIQELCRARGFALVEDCAQAHGAEIAGQPVGTFSDIAAWSFCQDKIVSTGGEGGMVATTNRELWNQVWSYKDHGKSWSAVYEQQHPPGFRWLHESFGSNARATEMQAAIGRIQYRKLADWHDRRTRNAEFLAALLKAIPGLRVPLPPAALTHAYYRLYAYVDSSALAPGWTRDRIIAEVNGRSALPITTGSSAEIYREKAFVDAGLAPREPLPSAHRLGQESLAFLVHPGLTSGDLQGVADVCGEVLARAVATS